MPDFRRSLRRWRRRLLFLAARQLMRVAGFRAARPIGRLLADLHYALAWRLRRRCLRDLAGLLARPAGDRQLQRQLREAWRANTVALLEVLAMFDRPLDDAALAARCEAEGLERLLAAHAAGHGAILLGSHMGNGALLAARLARGGLPVSVVFRQSRMMSADFFAEGLPRYGIEGIQANAGIRAYAAMLDALRRRRILFVMMDQGIKPSQEGVVLRFLGKDMPMSAGPAQLARQSRAPVLPLALTAAEPAWRFAIGEPLTMTPGGPLAADVETLARATERDILAHPQFWSWHVRRWRRFPMAAPTP